VVSRNGKLYAVELKDSKNPVEGDLLVETEVNEIAVKSAFKLLLEQAFALSMEEYAKECGVEMRTIIEVARELTSHGKRAVVEMYRGPVQQTDGYYSGCLIITLNILIGNADYKGGLIKGGGHWHESGGKVRQPVAKPFTEEVEVGGERMPICMETFMIAVARKLNLSGFGKNAFAPGMDFTRPEDWYLKEVANIAFGDKKGEEVPDAGRNELVLFRKARRHLPNSVFEEARWKKALRSEKEWRKVVYVLNRGGRYDDYGKAYAGDKVGYHAFGGMFHLFVEEVAKQKNSMSGKFFSGIPIIGGEYDIAGKPLSHPEGYPFRIITYKDPFSGQSRTISNYWGNISLRVENKILINRSDAQVLGLRQDQKVRLVSPDNPRGKLQLEDGENRVLDIAGKVRIVQGMRPGTLAVSWHYGHWAYGSNDVIVDGKRIKGDKRRAAGICTNHLLGVDPVFKDACLSDPIGRSASFSNSRVKVIPL